MDTLDKWWSALCAAWDKPFRDYDWQRVTMALALTVGLGCLLVWALKFSWPAFGIAAIIAAIIVAWFNEWGSEGWRIWAMRVSTTIVAGLAVCAGIGGGQVFNLQLQEFVDVDYIKNPPKTSVAKAEDTKEEKEGLKKGSPEWLEDQFKTIGERLDEYGRQINCLQEKEGGNGKGKTPAKAKSDADADTPLDFDDPPNLAKPAERNDGGFKRGLRAPTTAPATAPAPPPPDDGELKLGPLGPPPRPGDEDQAPAGLPPLPGDEEQPIQKIDRKNDPKKGAPKNAPKSDSPGSRIAIPRIADNDKPNAPQSASAPAKRILIGYDCDLGHFHPKEKLYQDPDTGKLLPYLEDLHKHPNGAPCQCQKWRYKEVGK